MPKLAIDTSCSICSIAIGDENKLLTEYHFAHDMSLLQRLIPTIEKLTQENKLKMSDIDGIIISLGPGSFTGLRIGVTSAKTLAWTLGVPIVGISTLEALTRSCSYSRYDYVASMVFSRVNEVYWSVTNSKTMEILIQPEASSLDNAIEKMNTLNGSIICNGSGAVRNRSRFEASGPDVVVAPDWECFARGYVLLNMGIERISSGRIDDPIALTPIYVRKPTPVVRKELAKEKQITNG